MKISKKNLNCRLLLEYEDSSLKQNTTNSGYCLKPCHGINNKVKFVKEFNSIKNFFLLHIKAWSLFYLASNFDQDASNLDNMFFSN